MLVNFLPIKTVDKALKDFNRLNAKVTKIIQKQQKDLQATDKKLSRIKARKAAVQAEIIRSGKVLKNIKKFTGEE